MRGLGYPLALSRWARLIMAAVVGVIAMAGVSVIVSQRESPAEGSARQRRAFLAEGNRVCARAVAAVNAQTPAPTAPPGDFVVAAQRTAAIDESAIESLRLLAPPPADRAEVQAILTQFEVSMGASRVKQAVIASKSIPDPNFSTMQAFAAIAAESNAIAEATRLARSYGLDRCADMIYTAV